MESCGTPAKRDLHNEVCPFKWTLWDLPDR